MPSFEELWSLVSMVTGRYVENNLNYKTDQSYDKTNHETDKSTLAIQRNIKKNDK